MADARSLDEIAKVLAEDGASEKVLRQVRLLLSLGADVDVQALVADDVDVETLVKIALLPRHVEQSHLVPDDSDNRLSVGWREEFTERDTTVLRRQARWAIARKGRRDLAIQLCLLEFLRSAEAAEELDAIDPEWPRSEAARQMVPRLLAAMTEPRFFNDMFGAAQESQRRELARRALDRVDPEWRIREAVRVDELVQTVCDSTKPGKERERALWFLAELDRDRALSAASALVTDSKRGLLQRAAMEVLARSGQPLVLEPLLAGLRVDDHEVVTRSAEALGKLGDRRAVPGLIEALRDWVHKFQPGSFRVVPTLAAALGRLGDPQGAEALGVLLADQRVSDDVKAVAATALGNLRDPKAVDALGSLLCRSEVRVSDAVRKAAVNALASIGGERAAELLREALTHRALGLEATVAMALFRLRDPAAVEALGSVLLDFHHNTSSDIVAAANALASIGGQRAAELLRSAQGAARDAWGNDQRPLHKLAKALESVERKLRDG